jgi:NitT/TauT family transport system substrate-binding protein
MIKSSTLPAVISAIVLLFGANLGSAQDRLRAGYSGISGYQVPLWLAVDLGLFKKYGLNLEPVLFRGGAESANAMSAGEIHFDVVAPQPHIAADLAGADITIIGTYFNKHTYSVVARPVIKSPEELRGKKIGVLSTVGLNQIVVVTALKHWGMEEKQVTLLRAGGSRDRLTALQNGLIDNRKSVV